MKRTSETRIAQLLELLSDGKPRTTPQAAQEMLCDPSTLSGAMYMALNREQVHIVDWVSPRRGQPIALYKVGKGRNKPKPAPMTRAESRRLQSLREIEERERLAEEKARPFVPFRDPMTAAFYGEYQRDAACPISP